MNDPDEIRIPEWIKQQCIAHRGQFVLRVFSIGGDEPLKTNAEMTYQVNHLTSVHNTPAEAIEDLRLRMEKPTE